MASGFKESTDTATPVAEKTGGHSWLKRLCVLGGLSSLALAPPMLAGAFAIEHWGGFFCLFWGIGSAYWAGMLLFSYMAFRQGAKYPLRCLLWSLPVAGLVLFLAFALWEKDITGDFLSGVALVGLTNLAIAYGGYRIFMSVAKNSFRPWGLIQGSILLLAGVGIIAGGYIIFSRLRNF